MFQNASRQLLHFKAEKQSLRPCILINSTRINLPFGNDSSTPLSNELQARKVTIGTMFLRDSKNLFSKKKKRDSKNLRCPLTPTD